MIKNFIIQLTLHSILEQKHVQIPLTIELQKYYIYIYIYIYRERERERERENMIKTKK